MKQLFNIMGSMKTMAVLMLIFAFSIGYATFVENDYGTMTAKADIYNVRWFEILLTLLTINLIYNMIKHKMFSIKKAPIFIFHLSFLIILVGAAITRYAGYEGTMHIREGSKSNTMTSSASYFALNASANSKNPKNTVTVVNQPPDFGIEFNQPGNAANSANGSANADENPNIPIIGAIPPISAASTKSVPTIGPVHEKETKANTNAIKKMPIMPPLSDA